MVTRRELLRALLFPALFAALTYACSHHRSDDEDEEKKDPFKREGGGY